MKNCAWRVAVALLATAGCKDEVPLCCEGDGDADADADSDGDGDADPYAEIAAAFDRERLELDVDGMAVAIVADGEVAWARGFGSTGYTERDVAPTTRFSATDVTYGFTFVALLQLVDRGLVGLDDPVIDHVPEFTLAASADLVPSITIRHLLWQRSGLPNGWWGAGPFFDGERDDSALDLFLTGSSFAETVSLVAPPGEVGYPGFLGAALAGLVVERVGGLRSYADYMRQNVFEPLGMTRTTCRLAEAWADEDRASDQRALGEDAHLRPAYGCWSTVEDLARWAEFLLHGNEAVLSQALLDQALEGLPGGLWNWVEHGPLGLGYEGYAVGYWGVPETYPYDFRTLHWGGTTYGHSSALTMVPSRGFAVLVMLNAEGTLPAESVFTALTTVLDLPTIEPLPHGEVDDPATLAGTYRLHSGNSSRVSVREDGGLRLSSPPCDLEPVSPGSYWCDSGSSTTPVDFLLDEEGRVEYLVTWYWVATPGE